MLIDIWVEDKDGNIYDLWKQYINIGKLFWGIYEDELDEYEVKYNTFSPISKSKYLQWTFFMLNSNLEVID